MREGKEGEERINGLRGILNRSINEHALENTSVVSEKTHAPARAKSTRDLKVKEKLACGGRGFFSLSSTLVTE